MKKLLLVLVVLLISVNSYAVWPFKKKPELEELPAKEIVIKPCYYYLEHSPNFYVVVSVLQDECSGVVLSGVMNGRKIIEYDDNLRAVSEQKVADDDTFREKVKSLWPDLQEIKFKPSE